MLGIVSLVSYLTMRLRVSRMVMNSGFYTIVHYVLYHLMRVSTTRISDTVSMYNICYRIEAALGITTIIFAILFIYGVIYDLSIQIILDRAAKKYGMPVEMLDDEKDKNKK